MNNNLKLRGNSFVTNLRLRTEKNRSHGIVDGLSRHGIMTCPYRYVFNPPVLLSGLDDLGERLIRRDRQPVAPSDTRWFRFMTLIARLLSTEQLQPLPARRRDRVRLQRLHPPIPLRDTPSNQQTPSNHHGRHWPPAVHHRNLHPGHKASLRTRTALRPQGGEKLAASQMAESTVIASLRVCSFLSPVQPPRCRLERYGFYGHR